jgi:antitoxin component of RelBE/YafQ-DinJ toxin-antitoxin module
VKGTSEAILIEGDTEEGTGDEEAQKKRDEENPLKVSYARNNLSVRARKQPLTVVLFKIASELGIPFELRYESPEVVDVDFNNYTVEQAIRGLSPAVRLFYRTDLQTYEMQPLRIVLGAPVVKS